MQEAKEEGLRLLTKGRRRRRRRNIGAVFFFWVFILILCYQVSFSFSTNNNVESSVPPPRRARFLDTASFHAPSSPGHHHDKFVSINGDPNTLYGDDKRIVHTGPNPLHN